MLTAVCFKSKSYCVNKRALVMLKLRINRNIERSDRERGMQDLYQFMMSVVTSRSVNEINKRLQKEEINKKFDFFSLINKLRERTEICRRKKLVQSGMVLSTK